MPKNRSHVNVCITAHLIEVLRTIREVSLCIITTVKQFNNFCLPSYLHLPIEFAEHCIRGLYELESQPFLQVREVSERCVGQLDVGKRSPLLCQIPERHHQRAALRQHVTPYFLIAFKTLEAFPQGLMK